MIERQGNVVVIHADRADFVELLEEASGLKLDANELTDQDQARFESLMGELAALEANQADGQVRARAGRFHFPLKKSIFNAVIIAAALAAAGVAVAGSGGAATPAVAVAVLGSLERINNLVKTLNPMELAVHDAVLVVSSARKKANTPPFGATAAEVEQYFLDQKQAPPNAALLTQLVNKKVLTSEVDGSVVRYSVVH